MRLRAALLASALAAQTAHADPLVLRATGGLVLDDNVFRLPSGVNPAIGGGRGETILQGQAAAHYENDISLQNVVIDAAVTRYDFQKHKDLSFTGINANGTWNWKAGSRFAGYAGYELQRRQSSFAEFRGFGRNIITVRQPFVEARYQPGATLFAYANYRHVTGRNSSAVLEPNDYNSDVYGGGAGYALRNGGVIRAGFKRTDRRFPTDQVVVIGGVPTPIRNDYVLDEAEANIVYPFTALTSLNGRVAYTKRKVETATARDFSGITGRLALDYKPGPLWAFQLAARRELTSEDDIQTNFVTARALSSFAEYRPRDYWSVRLESEISRRRYEGFASVAPTAGRDDRNRSYGISSAYLWRLGSRFDLSVRRESRNSTINALDYRATTGTATVTLALGSRQVTR